MSQGVPSAPIHKLYICSCLQPSKAVESFLCIGPLKVGGLMFNVPAGAGQMFRYLVCPMIYVTKLFLHTCQQASRTIALNPNTQRSKKADACAAPYGWLPKLGSFVAPQIIGCRFRHAEHYHTEFSIAAITSATTQDVRSEKFMLRQLWPIVFGFWLWTTHLSTAQMFYGRE